VILSALTAVLLVFVFTAHAQIPAAITIAVLGAAGFATAAPLQARVMQKAEGAPALASAANIAAFNVGNAGGAWLAGMAIDQGLGYTAPNWIGAALAASGLVVTAISGRLDRRTRHTTPVSSTMGS
jgi:DHA1 family inner membrane transport protein